MKPINHHPSDGYQLNTSSDSKTGTSITLAAGIAGAACVALAYMPSVSYPAMSTAVGFGMAGALAGYVTEMTTCLFKYTIFLSNLLENNVGFCYTVLNLFLKVPMNDFDKLMISLEPTRKSIAKLRPSTQAPHALGSHIMGPAYMPKGYAVPVSVTGQAWLLLAQINFAELPPNIDPDFPTSGMMQLYLREGSTMGIDFNIDVFSGGAYLCLYHPDPTLVQHDPNASAVFNGAAKEEYIELFPTETPIGLEFELSTQTLLPTDEAATHLYKLNAPNSWLTTLDDNLDDMDDLFDLWYDHEEPPYSQVGGYAYFTQDDPRHVDTDWVVLLQIDSDDALGTCWGDCGVANLSISRDALKARDFSKAWFTWDCC